MINYLSMETTSVSRRGEGGGKGTQKNDHSYKHNLQYQYHSILTQAN